MGFAVSQFHRGWRLAFDFIRKTRGAERDVNIVVAVDVHEGRVMRGYLYLEDAHVFVFERQVMTRLGGDFDL